MTRRTFFSASTLTAITGLVGAVGVTVEKVSSVVKDQKEVWGNVGWAATEITRLQYRIDELEKRVGK